VLAVLDSLKLNRPTLVGHSIAGEELSSVGSRHPDRVAGLIYLDAIYQYSFDNGNATTTEELVKGAPQSPRPGPDDLASFSALQTWLRRTRGIAFPESDYRQTTDSAPDGRVGRPRTPPSVGQAILAGVKRFTNIPVPALAICAVPQSLGPLFDQNNDPAVKAFAARYRALTEKQVDAFESGVPSARVIRMPSANHYIFISNEADVLREMRAFLGGLK
jgi:non-heme chloroperoxidase